MKQKEEIENILNSLDDLQKAGPGDFFFTRVQARLEKEETSLWSRVAGFITKPTVALATLCVICLLNAAALFYQHEASSSSLAEQLEQSSDDYNTTVATNTYYDENTTEAR
ncbi:MAG: hypothetical protein QM726_01895 [Chitinophagaceae bacterium]